MSAHQNNLRNADLIAKTAKVTLKGTLRVIRALQAVGHLQGRTPEELIDAVVYDTSTPTPENIAACEQAAFELKQQAKVDLVLQQQLRGIKGLV